MKVTPKFESFFRSHNPDLQRGSKRCLLVYPDLHLFPGSALVSYRRSGLGSLRRFRVAGVGAVHVSVKAEAQDATDRWPEGPLRSATRVPVSNAPRVSGVRSTASLESRGAADLRTWNTQSYSRPLRTLARCATRGQEWTSQV